MLRLDGRRKGSAMGVAVRRSGSGREWGAVGLDRSPSPPGEFAVRKPLLAPAPAAIDIAAGKPPFLRSGAPFQATETCRMPAKRPRLPFWPSGVSLRPCHWRLLGAAALAVVLSPIGTSQTPVAWPPSVAPEAEGSPPEILAGLSPAPAGKSGPVVQTALSGEMIGFSHVDGGGTQTITLVHTGKSWMAVYHVDRSGVIQLVSSRPIDADFSLQFNATSPLPEEIRKIGGRTR